MTLHIDVNTTRSMADLSDLFLVGDDLDAVLAILEDEEELEEEFTIAADNVQYDDSIRCELCQKKCKTKAGLKRHKTCKHKNDQRQEDSRVDEQQEIQFTVRDFVALSKEAREKIIHSKIYPRTITDELQSYCLDLNDSSIKNLELEKLYKCLAKSGDAEKFYSKFYASVVLHCTEVYVGLSRHAATILSTKVADCILGKSKQKDNSNNPDESPAKLNENETAGLQYLGGYVLHKLHNQHIKKKESEESEQSVSILKAGKEENDTNIESQQLTSSLNRGGLWAISKYAQLVFERVEHHFRIVTSNSLHNIRILSIESKSLSDTQLLSAYNAMVSSADMNISNGVAKDTLQSIIYLYIRVRCFSFARDIIQKHKIRAKQTKSKALRKDIARSSKEQLDRSL